MREMIRIKVLMRSILSTNLLSTFKLCQVGAGHESRSLSALSCYKEVISTRTEMELDHARRPCRSSTHINIQSRMR